MGPTSPQSATFLVTTNPSYYYYRQDAEKVAKKISMYQRKDHFYKKAKKEGLASRAAYKLLEIQEKYKIWRAGRAILDLGSAPGGWLEILSKEVGPQGKIVGVDRLPLHIVPKGNVHFIQKDIEQEPLEADLGSEQFDVILSDLSPNLSGIAFRDTYRSFELTKKVWELAQQFLKKNGSLVIKIFPGEENQKLQKEMKPNFFQFSTFIPEATRKTSSEVYLVAKGFKGG